MSNTLGINQEEFTKALVVAMQDPRVAGVLQSTVGRLEAEILDLKQVVRQRNSEIHSLKGKLGELEKKCDDLEQYSRRNSLRIQGLPETQYEDVGEKVLDLANDVLSVSPPLTPADIDRVHRIGKQPKPSESGVIDPPRPIILKLATYRVRDRVYRQRTSLKDYDVAKVYINEDLTAARSSLLWQARQRKKSKAIGDCWSHDGQVLIKTKNGKVKPIYTADDLPAARTTQDSAEGDDEATPLAASTDTQSLASAATAFPDEVWEKEE